MAALGIAARELESRQPDRGVGGILGIDLGEAAARPRAARPARARAPPRAGRSTPGGTAAAARPRRLPRAGRAPSGARPSGCRDGRGAAPPRGAAAAQRSARASRSPARRAAPPRPARPATGARSPRSSKRSPRARAGSNPSARPAGSPCGRACAPRAGGPRARPRPPRSSPPGTGRSRCRIRAPGRRPAEGAPPPAPRLTAPELRDAEVREGEGAHLHGHLPVPVLVEHQTGGAERLLHVPAQARPVERGRGRGHREAAPPRLGQVHRELVRPHEQLVGPLVVALLEQESGRGERQFRVRVHDLLRDALHQLVQHRPGATQDEDEPVVAQHLGRERPVARLHRVTQGLQRGAVAGVPARPRSGAAAAPRPAGDDAARRAVRRRTGGGSGTSRPRRPPG